MAIQMRRGRYENFDPTKLLPGEWAVVLSGDPNTANGQALYHCFAAGSVKRIATIEDAATIIANATEDIREELTQDIASALAQVGAATNAANTAIANANTAISAANAATQAATSASERAEDAIDAMGDISELAVPLMTPDIRGGAKLEQHGGLALRDGALGIGSLVQESDGYARGGLAEVTAKGHAEQFSTTGKNLLDESDVRTTSSNQVTFPFTYNGIVWARNNDGSITAKGTLSANQTQCLFRLSSLTAGTYTISGCPAATGADVYPWDNTTSARPKATDGTSSAPSDTGNGASFLAVDGHEMIINLRLRGQDETFDLTFYPQLEAGSTATAYEPYTGGAPSPSPNYAQEIQVVRGRNLFNKAAIYKRNHLLASDGSETEYNGIDIYESIPIDPTKSYYLKGRRGSNNTSDAIRVGYYSGTTFLSREVAFDKKLNVPANATSIRLCYTSVPGTSGEILDVQLTLGSTPQPYVPYGHVGLEVQGKNLAEPYFISGRTVNGTTWTYLGEGKWTISGTATAHEIINKSFYLGVLPAGTYTASCTVVSGTRNGAIGVRLGTGDDSSNAGGNYGDSDTISYTFTADGSTKYWLSAQIRSGTTVTNAVFVTQCELGSVATPYEPYIDSTTPIPLPSRGWVGSLPDGTADMLTLDGAGKCEWEESTEEVVFDGHETETYDANNNPHTFKRYGYEVAGMKTWAQGTINPHYLRCDRFIETSNDDAHNSVVGVNVRANNSNQVIFNVPNSTYPDIATFKTWLSTHPVTVLYPLATPVTEDCGYVDMPAIPSDAQISIPELDALGIRYFVDDTVTQYGREIYARVRSEYADRITALEQVVAEIIAG